MRKFYLRIRIFCQMVFSFDGIGNFIWPWEALWYARHLEWWGIE
mgnify:CR=1 FL=1